MMSNTATLTKEQAIELSEKETNHFLHIALTICTIGMWIPVWLIVAMNNSIKRTSGKTRLAQLGIEELRARIDRWL